MIEFTYPPGEIAGRIRLTPRPAFKNTHVQAIERDLVFGHYCRTCGNVVQACFLTDKPIGLWEYEETAFISLAEKTFGSVLNWVPNTESKPGYSQYHSDFYRTKQGFAQQLTMKNHVIRYAGLNAEKPKRGSSSTYKYRFNEDGAGGQPCMYVGLWSHRQDLMLKDLCLIWGYLNLPHVRSINDFKFGQINDVWDDLILQPDTNHYWTRTYRGLKSAGCLLSLPNGPVNPMLMFHRDQLTADYASWNQIDNRIKHAFLEEKV